MADKLTDSAVPNEQKMQVENQSCKAEASGSSEQQHADTRKKSPICVIVLGMAGSGKTSVVKKLTEDLTITSKAPYVINLDPACLNVPYPANIDIRDSVKFKEVMKQYKLGPNGGIVTSLNLFSTKFPQVISLLDKRSTEYDIAILDTPGQIEVFTWSASGAIITETLASIFPTVVVYIMDTVRSTNPVTFMSNMLYACSILYKTKLPFIVVLNKLASHSLKLCRIIKIILINSEYWADLLKSRQEKSEKNSAAASTVDPSPNMITSVPESQGLADIYLRHPGDESSEDEEGTEKQPDEEPVENSEAF
ncbi:hypothetical protein B566_EDAN005437 [Ephemera danica]|nr:hypothetical protein B566_EDAN005437 [Ephemera danica]